MRGQRHPKLYTKFQVIGPSLKNKLKQINMPNMAVYALISAHGRQKQVNLYEIQANLVYVTSSRPSKVT